MPYVGNKPEVGNFRKCDAITTSATATYNLLVGGVAVNPNQNQCIVSLNGVVQSSGNSYTIASSQITFASTLASSDVIDFILILGDTLDVGTVSDDTIGLAQLSATGTASSSTYLRGDNSWATAGGDLSFGGDTFGADKTIGSNDAYALSIETNNAVGLKIDNAGQVTKPLQSAFLITEDGGGQSITNATTTTITLDSEIFDVGANFSSNTFTAPVTGKYLITGQVIVDAGSTPNTRFNALMLQFVASNRTWQFRSPQTYTNEDDVMTMKGTAIVDMDASDTCYMNFSASRNGATGATTVYNNGTVPNTFLSGYLLG